MSEEKAEATEAKLPDIKCEEGPPQIVPAAAYPMSVKVATGSMPPLQFEFAPMRPVMAYNKGACGRHIFKEGVDPKSSKICGNCAYGVLIEHKEEKPKETSNIIKI